MNPIDPNQEIIRIVEFIKNTFKTQGFSKAVIGVSGGIDSATSLALTVKALGKENVFPLFLPYGVLGLQGVKDGQFVATTFNIPQENWVEIDIQSIVDSFISYDEEMDKVRKGNIMARMRMIYLYDQAKKRQALVVGTENKSEHLLGYYTRFGDEASDVEPMRNLYKTDVYTLAKILEIPTSILTKAPSANLWEGQTDEEEFGFSYKQADEILFQAIDEKKSVETINQKGMDKQIVCAVFERMKKNAFKHSLPYILGL